MDDGLRLHFKIKLPIYLDNIFTKNMYRDILDYIIYFKNTRDSKTK